MKTRFSSLDIACIVKELQELIGMRINQIYDIDNKTYLIKFQATDRKSILLIESGNRIHTTTFDWPKNDHPSGFSMKLRKHLRNKRLERIEQLGQDRIIDMEFGSGDAAYHIIIEMFDKGNMILTDNQLNIVNLLRPHSEKEYKFLVRETYPLERIKKNTEFSSASLQNALKEAKEGDLLKKVLIPFIDYGPCVVDHILLMSGFSKGEKISKEFTLAAIEKIVSNAELVIDSTNQLTKEPAKGFVIKKKETRADGELFYTNFDFQPFLFLQFEKECYDEYNNFNTAVDEFFSKLGSQKIDMKAFQEEKAALKKVEKIRLDQENRLKDLDRKQMVDATKAELIMCNVDKVEAAITAIRSALAAQMPWGEIKDLVAEAHLRKDPVGCLIKNVKLQTNCITLQLKDPFQENEEDPGTLVDVDLEMSAYANVKKYYDNKKFASNKQQKTLQAQGKALKTAEKKVETVLKDIQTNATITKSRTVFWFEKFLWFITSENYLVIGSRDKIQTELIVRRFMHAGDVFVHSDFPGASCFLIKNPSGEDVPPKSLNEAGTMAVCFSSAWEVHVIANAWWVRSEQVTKPSPSGPGPSYNIQGQKNYLLPAQLAIGFGFVFYVDSSCIERHINERQVKFMDSDGSPSQFLTDNTDSSTKLNEIHEELSEVQLLQDEDKPDISEEGSLKMEGTESNESLDSDDESDRSSKRSLTSDLGSQNFNPPKENEDFQDIEVDCDKRSEPGISENFLDQETVSNSDKSTSKRVKIRSGSTDSKKENHSRQKSPNIEVNALKRGQRSKLKKIKEKYKDQDEEDKLLRMAILQSAGSKKDSSKKKSKNQISRDKNFETPKKLPASKPLDETGGGKVEVDDLDTPAETDISMLKQLTGIPYPEDKIIFAMPVVAPYNTLVPYKFRVKMIPGTSKRGKSARSALNIFINNKECSDQEGAVMRNVNDQILCRDLPGKIKLSIGQKANKLKKRK